LEEGFGTFIIDISNVFEDEDEDELTYGVEVEYEGYVIPSIIDNNLILDEGGEYMGGTNVILTANDGNGGVTEDVFYVFVDMLWGVDGLDNTDIQIYPNPSSGIVNIDIKNNHNTTEFAVFNILGEEILNKKIDKSGKMLLDLSTYKKGVYIIKITSNNQSLIKNIIIE